MDIFTIDYSKKTLSLKFGGEVFNFNLNDGDIGDFWHSFTTKDEVIKDISFHQEDPDQEPSVSVYGVIEVDGELTIDVNDNIYIGNYNAVGNPDHYFNGTKLIDQGDFDDIVTDTNGRQWSQLCPGHTEQIIEDGTEHTIDSMGGGICGIKGCDVESEYYIDFSK